MIGSSYFFDPNFLLNYFEIHTTVLTNRLYLTKQITTKPKPIRPNGSINTNLRTEWIGDRYNGLKEQTLFNPDGSVSENIAIIKNNKIVNTMSHLYHVFANADLVEILDEEAKLAGAVPLNKKNGIGRWGKIKGNVIEDSKYGTRALIQYKFPKLEVDITGAGDANVPTFSGSNSEDGRGGALKILGGFLRTYCDNLSYTFVPSKEIKGLNSAKLLWNNKKYQQKNPEIEAKVKEISVAVTDLKEANKRPKFFTKHSKQVKDLEGIRQNIRDAIESIKIDNEFVANRYKELYKLKFNSYVAQELVNNLPKNVYDAVPSLEVKKDGKVTFDQTQTTWDVYNYITKELTFNANSPKTFGSTLTAQKKVENIFIRQPIEVLTA